MSTTATVDFTLLYGGVACVPTSEVPFAGDYFDVRSGTYEEGQVGSPSIVAAVGVQLEGFENSSQVGSIAVTVQHSVIAVGFENESSAGSASVTVVVHVKAQGASNSSSLGKPAISTRKIVGTVGFASPVAQVGEPDVSTHVDVYAGGASNVSTLGVATVRTSVDVTTGGILAPASSVGYPLLRLVKRVSVSGIAGEAAKVSGVSILCGSIVSLDGWSNESRFGTPLIRLPHPVYPEGFEDSSNLGSPLVSTRKDVKIVGFEAESSAANDATVKTTKSVKIVGVSNLSELGAPSLSTVRNIAPVGFRDSVEELGDINVTTHVDLSLGGVLNSSSLGTVEISTTRDVYPVGFEAEASQVSVATVKTAKHLIVTGADGGAVATGQPVVSTVVDVALSGIENSSEVGHLSVGIIVYPAGIENISQAGTFHATTLRRVFATGFANTSTVSPVTVRSLLDVKPAGIRSAASKLGTVSIETASIALPHGIDNLSLFGEPLVLTSSNVAVVGFENESGVGEVGLEAIVQVELEGFAGASEVGVPTFIPRACVKIRGFSDISVIGKPVVDWRKIVRWAVSGEIQTTEHLDAVILPKPSSVEHWSGDATLEVSKYIEALVAAERFIDSTARRHEVASGVLKKVVNA